MTNGRPSLRWSLDWKSALVMIVMLPVLISLGNWQLRRADEKAAILAAANALREKPPVSVLSVNDFPNYLPVWAEGEFDTERYWLLDNRIFQGRFGYEIIALLRLADGRDILVDRGWIAGDRDRSKLPEVAFPQGTVRVHGELYRGVGKQYSLGEEASGEWPRRQQWLELEDAVAEFPSLLPSILRLDERSPAALRVQRIVVNVTPQKHTGYAVQWFAMAFVLSIIFFLRNSNIAAVVRGRSQD